MKKLIMKIGSVAIRTLLRSPLHALISHNTLLIVLAGSKTGREYSLPVNYVQHGRTFYIISKRSRTWWRNLRGGKPVHVWLRGKQLKGQATTDEDYVTISENLKNLLQNRPELSRYFGVRPDSNNPTDLQDVPPLVQEQVLVKVNLDERI